MCRANARCEQYATDGIELPSQPCVFEQYHRRQYHYRLEPFLRAAVYLQFASPTMEAPLDKQKTTEKTQKSHDRKPRSAEDGMPHLDDPHPGSVSDGTHPEANEDKSE